MKEFNEFVYLKYNKDVKEAVEKGIFRDGKEHFEKFGKNENRIYSLSQVDTDLTSYDLWGKKLN